MYKIVVHDLFKSQIHVERACKTILYKKYHLIADVV